jgi:hypothetical protein
MRYDGSWQSMSKPSSKTPKPAAAKPAAPKPKPLPLDEAILDALTRNGAGTLSPPEIAHVIEPEGDWHALLMPIRRAAVTLALADRLVIYRKGKPVEDPNDFRGVYRLGLPKVE